MKIGVQVCAILLMLSMLFSLKGCNQEALNGIVDRAVEQLASLEPAAEQHETTAPVPAAPASEPSYTAPVPESTEPLDTPEHTHTWYAVYSTVHHDAVTEEAWVVDQSAYDEPVYQPMIFCRCGATFGSWDAYVAHSDSYIDTSDWSNHSSCSSGEAIVGYEHHDETGHYETRLVQDAYEEQVIAYYECACGERRPA